MDFKTVEASQLQGNVSVTQLAAEVRQVLLATTVDIEQRWQFLTPEDRVAALTDLIALTLVYNRAFADAVNTGDDSVMDVEKGVSEAVAMTSEYLAAFDKLVSDAVTPSDAFARVSAYLRTYDDTLAVSDVLDRVAQFARGFTDTAHIAELYQAALSKPVADTASVTDSNAWSFATAFADAVSFAESVFVGLIFSRAFASETVTADAAYSSMGKAFDDIGGDYVESGYWEEDYFLQTGPTVRDSDPIFALDAVLADSTPVSDELDRAAEFVREMQDLVAVAEEFARTVDYSRSLTDTATTADSPAKTFTTAFSDIGGLYATTDYFDDDYVEEGTGPAVYDTFSYTLN